MHAFDVEKPTVGHPLTQKQRTPLQTWKLWGALGVFGVILILIVGLLCHLLRRADVLKSPSEYAKACPEFESLVAGSSTHGYVWKGTTVGEPHEEFALKAKLPGSAETNILTRIKRLGVRHVVPFNGSCRLSAAPTDLMKNNGIVTMTKWVNKLPCNNLFNNPSKELSQRMVEQWAEFIADMLVKAQYGDADHYIDAGCAPGVDAVPSGMEGVKNIFLTNDPARPLLFFDFDAVQELGAEGGHLNEQAFKSSGRNMLLMFQSLFITFGRFKMQATEGQALIQRAKDTLMANIPKQHKTKMKGLLDVLKW